VPRKKPNHEFSYWLATNLTKLVMEDLNIAGMMRMHSVAAVVADAGMGQLGRMIQYKARWYGLELVSADRWFASSKTCSNCSHVKDKLDSSASLYICDGCGLRTDRDVNAAINLARWERKSYRVCRISFLCFPVKARFSTLYPGAYSVLVRPTRPAC
jgi:putative transposase